MNAKNLLLGVFVILTIVFGSLTVIEYNQVNALHTQFSNQSKNSSTQTLTTTTTIVSVVTLSANTTYGSFSYSPTSQVRVDFVRAIESPSKNGMQNVTFLVTFTNTGSSPIYAIGGWVNALSSSIVGNSSVLMEAPAVQCPGAIYLVTINHGQNYTVYAPDCGTGFNYQLVHPGSISVRLTFGWTTNHQENLPFSNSTTILASFTFV